MDQALKQWLTGRKEGKVEIQKFEYLENEKSFLDEIKTSFIVFEGLSFGEKKKFLKKLLARQEVLSKSYLIAQFKKVICKRSH